MINVQWNQQRRLHRFCAGCLIFVVLTACSSLNGQEEGQVQYEMSEAQPLTNSGTRSYWWSPTQNQILFNWRIPNAGSPGLLPDGPLLILDVPSGETHLLPQTGSLPLWSPSGEAILLRSGHQLEGTLQFWHYRPADEQLQPVQPSSFGMPVQWLNDGQLLYVTPSNLWLGQLDGTAGTLSEPTLWLDLNRLALGPIPWQITSPAGNAVVLLSGRKENRSERSRRNQHMLWLIRLDRSGVAAEPQLLTSTPDGIGFCCRWSADGRFFAFAAFEPEHGIYLVDLQNGGDSDSNRQPQLLVAAASLGQGHFISMDFAPNSGQLVFEWAPAGDGFPFAETELYLIAPAVAEEGERRAAPQRLTPPGSGSHNWVRWSPQANYLSFQPESDPDHRTWLAQISAAGSAQGSVPIRTIDIHVPRTISAANREGSAGAPLAPGFQRTPESHCPSGASLAPPVQWHNSQFPEQPYRQEIATIFLQETPIGWSAQDIPLRRRRAAQVDLMLSSLLMRDDHFVGIQVGYRAARSGQEHLSISALTPGLYLHGIFAELIAPVVVRGPVEVVTTTQGITCWPPEVTTVNDQPAILLRQRTAAATNMAYNHLIWREDGVYWRLSAPDVSAGGSFSADDLRRIAEEELETYNTEEDLWQPE